MDVNETLIKEAVAGSYGRETKEMAKNWAVCSLVQGKKIPLSFSELYEAYHDFDTAFVSEFVKHQDWSVIWKISTSYCEYKDVHLVWVRILLELLTSPIDNLPKELIQDWLLIHTENQKIAFVLLEKAQKYPQLLDWGLCYLAKYKEFSDANKLMSQIKRVASRYPMHVLSAARLIACVAGSGRGYHVQAVKILAELLLMKELDNTAQQVLKEEISHQLDLMDVIDLRRFLYDNILSAEYRVSIGTRIVKRGYWDNKILKDISATYQLAFAKNENVVELIKQWYVFIDTVLDCQDGAIADVFMAVNEAISSYVEKMQWDVSLMEWNPGMNFQNYSPEFTRMTIKSLDCAAKCKQFRPRAFLTALNMWMFDETKVFDETWFENMISKLPQNHDKSLTWDDDLQVLFNHLAYAYRYRQEIQKKDGCFILEQAKRFVQLLIANYALNAEQIVQMRNLCVRLELDVCVDFEIKEMEERLVQIQHQKEAEQRYLEELFTV